MLNPTGLLDQAQLRQAELIRQAEKERLYRQLKAKAKPISARSTAPIPVYGKR